MYKPQLLHRVSFFIFAATAPVVAQVQGPSSSQSPYLLAAPGSGVKIISILTAGDSVNNAPDGTPYRMVGAPDGLGAFFQANEGIDNDSDPQGHGGRFTLLMNHEIGATAGKVHAHGSSGAFVSRWTIDRDTLEVIKGEDLIQQTFLWNAQSASYDQATTALVRFCSNTLADQSAFYDPITETGIKAEFTHHGFRSRVGRKRVDVAHQWLDPVIVAGPWILAGGLAVSVVKGLRRALSR